ncbi:MAG TPA: hypothetical protein VM901_04880 [Bdellovibrionota bacterium]|nr:hypothetical protein [Bdellovibrionota bacterium]
MISLLAACSANDQVTPYAGDDGTVDDDDYTASLYAYPSASTVSVGGYTYIYAQGGTSPYTYSVSAGEASINASSGYLQVSGEGTITVLVRDSAGGTYNVTVYTETETGTGDACVYLGAKTERDSGSAEARIDLPTHAVLLEHVIVGLGARLDKDSLVGLYVKTAKLNADGSISTSNIYNYKTGDLGTTTKGEIYVDLPAGYYLTGVGVASDEAGNNLAALKLYGAKTNVSAGQAGTVECLVDKEVQKCSVSSLSVSGKTYYSRYNEYRASFNTPVVTYGFALGSAKVTSRNIATKTITTSTTDSNLCPQ